MKKPVKIKTTGEDEILDVPEAMDWRWPSQQIGCDLIDITNASHLSDGCVMIVDDEGLLKDDPELNPIATMAYRGGTPIVGDVLFMGTEHTPEGVETVGLTNEQVRAITLGIAKIIMTRYMTEGEEE